jgi:Ca-activated chloride channel family protein
MDSQDIKPSRLDKVKFEMSKILDGLDGDRIGVVVFSGSNFLYLPLTLDYDASRLFIRSIDTSMVSSRGTNIPSAIETSIEAFENKDERQKLIFLFSDGEDHSEGSIETISMMIKDKISLHVIGVGSSKGSLVPLKNKENIFVKDSEGKLVLSKINIEFLKKLSSINSGSFLRISKSEPISKNIIDIIKSGEDSLISSFEFSDYDHKFQYPLAIALLFLIVSFIIPSGRKMK